MLGSPLLLQLTLLVINSQKGRRTKQKQNLSQGPELATLCPLWGLPLWPSWLAPFPAPPAAGPLGGARPPGQEWVGAVLLAGERVL